MRIILLLTVLGISMGCAHRSRLMPIGPENQVLEDVRLPLVAEDDPQGELRVELLEEMLTNREGGFDEVLRLRIALINATPVTAAVDVQAVQFEDQGGRMLPVAEIDLPGSNEAGPLVVPAGERAVAEIRLDASHVERLLEIASALLTIPYRLGDEEYRCTVVYERIWPRSMFGGLAISFNAVACGSWSHSHFHRPPSVARHQVQALSAGGEHLKVGHKAGTYPATRAGGFLKAKPSGSRKSSQRASPSRSRSKSSKSSRKSSPSRSRPTRSRKSSGRSRSSRRR